MRRGSLGLCLAQGVDAVRRKVDDRAVERASGTHAAAAAVQSEVGAPGGRLGRHRVVVAVAVALLYVLLLIVWMRLLPRPFAAAPRRLLGLDASRVIFPSLLLSALGWWRLSGLRVLPWSKLVFFLPPAVFPAALAVGLLGAHVAGGPIWLFVATDLAVAVGEESVFRGLVLRLLQPAGAMRAAVVSSLLFGAIHSVNLLGGVQPTYVWLQIVWTTLIGFAFAATVLASGNLWPAIAIHFAIDLLNDLSAATPAVGSSSRATLPVGLATVAAFAVLAAYGWWLLRAMNRPPTRRRSPRLDRRDPTALPWSWLPDNPYAALPAPTDMRLADVPVGGIGSPAGHVSGVTADRRSAARG